LRQLGTLLAIGTAGELTDGQLLERFATRAGDAAEHAFATLVERHGPMVLRVCRGVLFDPNDAEDAFQATFLVLVQKARSLWVCESLGPWLHQVALRTASCARSAAARRQRHERVAAVSVRASHADSHDDLGHVLHEEIDRLPESFRISVILCDLEGRTHEQAARHLGWPVGTVKSRLTRARERLRDRLTRRGVSPTAGVITLLRPGVMENLLPGALVQATTSAAVRFGASRTILGGSAAVLAQGVLTAMSMTRWWKVASLLLVAGATVSSAGLLAGKGTIAVAARAQDVGRAAAASPGADMPVAEVKSGKHKIAVVEPGTLDSSRRTDVLSRVEGPTMIISILPEGTKVKKGDLVCELDSAMLQDKLTNQRIATQGARAAYEKAKLAREVAEIALVEYEQGIYPSDMQTIQGAIKTAELDLKKTEARLERTRRARQKLNDVVGRRGRLAESSDILAELDLDDRLDAFDQALSRERLSLEQAQSKLAILNNYTKGKTIKELRSEVEKARSDELAKEATYELERAKETKLEKQIINCKLFAPGDGIVVYATDPLRSSGSNAPRIEEGATVRERQRIFSLPDITRMQVNTTVHGSQIDKITPNMKARVRVDAFSDTELEGTVLDVAPLPDPTNVFSSDVKVYTTRVRIDNPLPGLRPGMNAWVAITFTERDNVIMVPRTAVLHFDFDNKTIVKVKKQDGGFESREIVTGDLDETATLVEIKQGLKPGEQVAKNPLGLLSNEEQSKRGQRRQAAPPAERAAQPKPAPPQ